MPTGLDGINVTQQIRAFNNTTPIIGMPPPPSSSNNNSATNTSDYLNYSGMSDILPKPFTIQGLYAKIDKYCDHLKANVLMSPSSQNDGDNSTTMRRRQSNSLSSNLNIAVTSAQDTT